MYWTRVRVAGVIGLASCTVYGMKVLQFGENKDSLLLPSINALGTTKKASVQKLPPWDLPPKNGNESEELLKDMKLKSIQIFFRHGARTPLRHIPNVEEARFDKEWLLGKLPYADFPIEVITLDGQPQPFQRLESIYKKVHFEGGCTAGTLTKLGQDQAVCFGREIKKKYIDKLKLIDSQFDTNTIRIRSTNVNRTIQSLQCVLAGMFEAKNLRSQGPIKISVSNSNDEILHPNFRMCQSLMESKHKMNRCLFDIPKVKEVTDKVNKVIGHEGELNLMMWRDHLMTRLVHGLPIPQHLINVWADIEEAAVNHLQVEMCGMPSDRKHILKLSSGPILHMIKENMEYSQTDKKSARMFLFSCHDSSIIPLLSSLEAFDNQWPPYCANLVFELWEDKSGSHWVNLAYCGQDLIPSGHKSSVMKYDDFKRLISPYAVNKPTYKKLCVDLVKSIREAGIVDDGDGTECEAPGSMA